MSKPTADSVICKTCEKEKPLSEYYLNGQYPRKDCKRCFNLKIKMNKILRESQIVDGSYSDKANSLKNRKSKKPRVYGWNGDNEIYN